MATSTPALLERSEPPEPGRRSGRRRRVLRRLLVAILALVLVLLGVLGYAWYRVDDLVGDVHRLPDAFPEQRTRPQEVPAAKGSMTVLLVGSDSRSGDQTTGEDASGELFRPGAQRTDTIMLVHLDKEREKAYVVSIPRDSWVPVPGHGKQKINAGFSYGGVPLLVQTVEDLTDVHVDHVAVIDFEGFRGMTSALGGVDVRVRQTTTDPRSGRTFPEGVNHLEGQAALDFVRQRYGLPRGDLDRVERQQAFIRALMVKTRSSGLLTNPLRVDDFLSAATSATTVDEDLDNGEIRSLALSLRGLGAQDTTFMTAPVSGLGREGAQSVVYLDTDRGAPLWTAIRTDRMARFLSSAEGNDVSGVR